MGDGFSFNVPIYKKIYELFPSFVYLKHERLTPFFNRNLKQFGFDAEDTRPAHINMNLNFLIQLDKLI